MPLLLLSTIHDKADDMQSQSRTCRPILPVVRFSAPQGKVSSGHRHHKKWTWKDFTVSMSVAFLNKNFDLCHPTIVKLAYYTQYLFHVIQKHVWVTFDVQWQCIWSLCWYFHRTKSINKENNFFCQCCIKLTSFECQTMFYLRHWHDRGKLGIEDCKIKYGKVCFCLPLLILCLAYKSSTPLMVLIGTVNTIHSIMVGLQSLLTLSSRICELYLL